MMFSALDFGVSWLWGFAGVSKEEAIVVVQMATKIRELEIQKAHEVTCYGVFWCLDLFGLSCVTCPNFILL